MQFYEPIGNARNVNIADQNLEFLPHNFVYPSTDPKYYTQNPQVSVVSSDKRPKPRKDRIPRQNIANEASLLYKPA